MSKAISPSSFGVLLFLVACFMLLVYVVGPVLRTVAPDLVSSIQTENSISPAVANPHAVERHGQAAMDVAASFDDVGHCNMGNSIRLKNVDGRKMDICFESSDPTKVDLHVTNSQGGPITDIPSHDISAPLRYLRNVIDKMGYNSVEAQYGDVPSWFKPLLDNLIH